MSKLLWVFARLRGLIHACGHSRYLLAALVLLGAAARLRQYLAQTSYWHDEAYLLLNVFPKSFLELVGPLSHDQAAPPLFLWMLRACYLALGPSELVMRLPALLASLAALGLMAPLARLVVGGRSWLWAVGCAAVSSCLLYLTCQVKPYTTDVLLAEAILLATIGCLTPGLPDRWRRASHFGLLLAALVGPWLSFPSVFVTGAACLTLLLRSVCSNQRAEAPALNTWWAGARKLAWPTLQSGALASALLVSSCAALWLVAARHHNTAYQQNFWAADFVDLSSPAAALAWLGRKLLEAGNYGVQGTGVPMALLAAVGLVSFWRRQPWTALALASPAVLGCLAAALRHYPLGNRLLAFLLPCLWLLAAQGAGVVTSGLRQCAAWLACVPALILVPGGVYTARYAIFPKPSVEFRHAFECVHRRMREGDSLWVSQPEVYEVYFGRRDILDATAPPAALAAAARRGRVWMLCHPPAAQTTLADDARRHILTSGAAPMGRLEFVHLDVTVFAPAGTLSVDDNP